MRTSPLINKIRKFGRNKHVQTSFSVLAIILFIIFILIIKYPAFTGLFAAGELITYSQPLNLEIEQNQTIPTILEEHPKSFNLFAFKASGAFAGEGKAKVFLETPSGERFLVLDTSRLQAGEGTFITGKAVEGAEVAVDTQPAEEPSEPPAEETPAEEETEEQPVEEESVEEASEEVVEEEPIEEPAEEPTKEEVTEEMSEEEQPIEEPAEREVGEEVEEEILEEVLENVTEEVEENVTVELPEENITEEIVEENITIPINETIEINETLIENITEEIINKTIPLIEFEDFCLDTCLLPSGLNLTDYTLIVEIDSGVLTIDEVKFIVKDLTEPIDITYQKIKDAPRYDLVIDSIVEEEDDLVITFHHNANEELPVEIKGKINYTLDQEEPAPEQTATLRVHHWDNDYFRIKVGEEIFEFGLQQEFDFNPEIKDAQDELVEYNLEFEDVDTEEIKESETITKPQGFALAGTREIKVKEGKYNIKIKPKDHPIKEIEIHDADITADTTEFINLDDVPEFSNYVEVYAIDPTRFNLTSATVTVTAKGTRLYKCKDWNFTEQKCYGEWTFLQSITPGQNYTFTLTPEDPGLAESGGTFFEDFESGSLATNNWTNTGATNWAVSTTEPYAGTYNLVKASKTLDLVETNIDTTSYTDIQFSFYAKTTAFDTGEYLSAEWYNGTTWIEVLNIQTIATFTLYNYSLDSTANNNPNFKIRFTSNSDKTNERANIDNVQITGTLIVDTTPPATITNLASLSQDTTSIYWNWTNPTDGDFNSSIIYIDGTWEINTSNNFYNKTSLTCGTTHNITINTKDHTGNVNTTDVINITSTAACPPDTTAPVINSINVTPDPVEKGQNINITANVTDNVNVGSAWVEIAGTNYTMNQNGDIWNYLYDTSSLSLGLHNYIVYANDTSNNNATPQTGNFTVQDTTAPTWDETPQNQTIEYGTAFSYDVNASDNVALDTYFIDDTTNFTIDAAGVITNATGLSVGSYNLNVSVNDTSNNVLSTVITITVEDNTAPTWDEIPPNVTLEYGMEALNVDFNASDNVGIDSYAMNDSNFAINGSGVLINNTGLAIGTYLVNVSVNDTSNNINSLIYEVVVEDTTPPGIVTNLASPSQDTTSIYWNWTEPGDSDFNSSIIYVDGTWEINLSAGTNYYNKTGLSCGTTHNITVHTKDHTGNVNNTDVINITSTAACPDNSGPFYSNINEPTDPSTYSPSATYNFNITWTDPSGVDEVILEFDGTNYSYKAAELTKTGDVYNKLFGALAAGLYNYTWYANDTVSNNNNTGPLNFTINPASTTLTLTSSPSWNETYGTETTVNCSVDNSEVTPHLYKDGQEVSIPDVQTLAATTYDYICNATATQNYSAPTQQQNNLTINEANTIVNLSLNGVENNITITYPQTITAVYSTNALTATMYRNGSDISSENNTLITLAVGNYNYTVINLGNENYTSSSKTFFATINKNTSTCSLTFNPASPQTYGTQINASCSCTNPEATTTLYRNGTNVTATENNQLITLATGTYDYVCNISETQNYTSSSDTANYTINKAASEVNLLLNGTDSNISIVHDRTINITAQRTTGEGTIQLYEDGTLINSGVGPLTNLTSYHNLGLKNITVIYSETENYTASSETHWITVTNQVPTLDSISIDPTTGKQNVLVNVSTNNASDTDNDNYTLRCGDSSGLNNLCNSTVGTGEHSCTFNSPWSDDNNHTIYCRLDDTINLSSEKTILFTADNTASISLLTAVDGDTVIPYWDTSNNSQTILSGTTESGSQCRWGTTDVVYSSMSNDCSVTDGDFNCNLGNVAQINSTTYYVSCKDEYDNEQSTGENLDVAFGVDYTVPTTYDNYDGSIAIPGLEVTIYEADIPNGTVITTWYCAPTIGCTPETLIDDRENVTFNGRGTNYLRYYSKDEANNTQSTRTTQVFINNLINIGSINYTDSAGHSFEVAVSPTDVDSSQNLTCSLYHRLNDIGNYSNKTMTGTTTKTATLSTADGYTLLDILQLYINCTDELEAVNTSSETHQLTNNLPNTPTLTAPDNNTLTTNTSIILSYSSSDLDNDTITYYVYGDITPNPTTLIYNGTSTNYNWTLNINPNGIQNNYWKVLASDSYQNSSFSGIRTIIVNDTKGMTMTDPVDQETDRNINATYTITLTNNGAVTDNFTLTVENINGASTTVLNQSSVTIAAGENRSIELYVTDDDTVGVYVVNVTAISDSDASISEKISITTTVFGTLSASVTHPAGDPPPIYYEAQEITFQGYVYDELNNPVTGTTVTFEPIYSSYGYLCDNITDENNGYYNCTHHTSGMQTSQYYDVRINASKNYYHSINFTNTSVFLLSENQEANLTLTKSTSVESTNGTHIVYNITNTLTNIKGTSVQTNLTDPDAQQTWSLGNLSAGTVTRNYLLTFARALEEYQVTLNKSNATGYDPLYDNNLFAESNQPTIIIPENQSLRQLTVIKNLVFKNETSTNITYEITIEVVNSGYLNLENIQVNDTDLNLSTLINLTKSNSWQTSADLLIHKNPQPYVKSFAKTTAAHENYTAYSNQQNITISGYGGPYDVIITSLPSSVETGSTITGQIQVINQNTEVEEDRTLTTWIEDDTGYILDLDIRTIFVNKNQSIYTDVNLTAPSSAGTYYFISELTWPTATANATRSFTVVSVSEEVEEGAGTVSGGAAPRLKIPVCGDDICNLTELQGGQDECLKDCGYDCDQDGLKESWSKCIITICYPDNLIQDIIILRNKVKEIEKQINQLKERGIETKEIEELLSEVKAIINEAEERIAKGELDWARNLIRNAYVKIGSIIIVETTKEAAITGATVIDLEKAGNLWRLISPFLLIFIVIAVIVVSVYYKYRRDEEIALMLLKTRRVRLERINSMIDKTIDNLYLKDRGQRDETNFARPLTNWRYKK